MNDEYLWNPAGPPDPEVERLENLLREFRASERPLPILPELSAPPGAAWSFAARPWARFAAAAILLTIATGTWFVFDSVQPFCEVQRLTGAPQVASRGVRTTARLLIGEWLETDANSKARLNMNDVGDVVIDPNSKLQLLETGAHRRRLLLDWGTLHAMIWAPPRVFVVDTPSAVATDLGCQYTLHVDPSGSGELHVTFGWVAFDSNGRESFVPAGAMCLTRRGPGPGTPFYENAPEQFRSALEQLDFGPQEQAARDAALATILSSARPRDSFTLWHLLDRTTGAERARVFDRLAQLTPPPSGVTREGILAGDRRMRDLLWDRLGLGDTSWWRFWEGPVPVR